MPASPARIEANRRNALKSTGPTTPEGKQRSRRNALKHGLTGAGAALPDAIAARAHAFELGLRAEFAVGEGDALGRFLVAQAALAMARMELCPNVEWDARREQLERAAHSWDLDRAIEADELADRLPRRPALVSPRLLRTSQGCAWLIARWSLLAGAIEAAGSCGEPLRLLMADLLGIPDELRAADPRLSPDRTPAELAALARAERDRLAALKAEVLDPRDARDRTRALDGLAFDDSPAARRLRGYEAACDRRLRWALDQLRRRRDVRADAPPASAPSPVTCAAPRSSLPWPPPAAEAAAIPGPEPAAPPSVPIPDRDPSPTPDEPEEAPLAPTTTPRHSSLTLGSESEPATRGPRDRSGPSLSDGSPSTPIRSFGPRPLPPTSRHDRGRPDSPPLEKRTQPGPESGPSAPSEAPVLLNRRARRAAAALARRRG